MPNIKGGKSTQIALRVPNDLYDMMLTKGITEGLVKDGQPSVTLIVTEAVKLWLGVSDERSQPVEPDVIQQLQAQIAELSNAMLNTVKQSDLPELEDRILGKFTA